MAGRAELSAKDCICILGVGRNAQQPQTEAVERQRLTAEQAGLRPAVQNAVCRGTHDRLVQIYLQRVWVTVLRVGRNAQIAFAIVYNNAALKEHPIRLPIMQTSCSIISVRTRWAEFLAGRPQAVFSQFCEQSGTRKALSEPALQASLRARVPTDGAAK